MVLANTFMLYVFLVVNEGRQNGDCYEGEFFEDCMHGIGVFVSGKSQAHGRWDRDNRVGRFEISTEEGRFEELYNNAGNLTKRTKLDGI